MMTRRNDNGSRDEGGGGATAQQRLTDGLVDACLVFSARAG